MELIEFDAAAIAQDGRSKYSHAGCGDSALRENRDFKKQGCLMSPAEWGRLQQAFRASADHFGMSGKEKIEAWQSAKASTKSALRCYAAIANSLKGQS